MKVLLIFAGILKAILASLIAAGSTLLSIMGAGNESLSAVTGAQWVEVALAGMVALDAVYAIPNIKSSPPSA